MDGLGIDGMPVADVVPQLGEHVTAPLHHVLTVESHEQAFGSRMREESAHGGQFAERIGNHVEEAGIGESQSQSQYR